MRPMLSLIRQTRWVMGSIVKYGFVASTIINAQKFGVTNRGITMLSTPLTRRVTSNSLSCKPVFSVQPISTIRRRKTKMNKHKLRKRRKLLRRNTKISRGRL